MKVMNIQAQPTREKTEASARTWLSESPEAITAENVRNYGRNTIIATHVKWDPGAKGVCNIIKYSIHTS